MDALPSSEGVLALGTTVPFGKIPRSHAGSIATDGSEQASACKRPKQMYLRNADLCFIKAIARRGSN